jgi:hypothetical protein
MEQRKRILGVLVLSVFVLIAKTALEQRERNADRTLSPYFFVKSNDPEQVKVHRYWSNTDPTYSIGE